MRMALARGLKADGLELHTASDEISKHFDVYFEQNAVYNVLMMLSMHGVMSNIRKPNTPKQRSV